MAPGPLSELSADPLLVAASAAGLEAAFAPDGGLSRAVPGYRMRPQQLEMAQAVTQALERHGILVAEAGTGTGKTFAYLVPALLSGGKVILSTGTKTLQDQLFQKDLPAVRQALRVPVTVALLKGRANYVCHYHLERALESGRFMSRDEVRQLHRIAAYAQSTSSGDKSGLLDVPEHSPVWPAVTSTRDNCLGAECSHHSRCFVLEARKQALEADVVVVNHHLFFADIMLRDEGAGELLPACNAVILDEAHQLPEIAGLFFGTHVSTTELLELARDSELESRAAAADFAALPDAAQALDKAARDLRLAFPAGPARLPAHGVFGNTAFAVALSGLRNSLAALGKILETQAERSEGLERCRQRALELVARLESWDGPATAGEVRWVEVFTHAVQLNATPLSVADIFQREIASRPRAWIFTSATLAVNGDFSLYRGQLGLEDSETAYWASPFDYPRQALLYVPSGLPPPNTPGYTEAAVAAALPLIRAAGGRSFFLCTSLRAMGEVHKLLQAFFQEAGLDYPLLLQGERPRNDLLESFRRLGNAVLVGSQSFWEGVDVRGEALSLVIIDRLPFASPDDPLVAGRIEQLRRAGRNPFMEYQLPEAVITLKQGAGRLIRDETDRGVLMICDPRLVSSRYGKRIWRSLPPMRRTRELKDALEFFGVAP